MRHERSEAHAKNSPHSPGKGQLVQLVEEDHRVHALRIDEHAEQAAPARAGVGEGVPVQHLREVLSGEHIVLCSGNY